jgi:hypothetical protein
MNYTTIQSYLTKIGLILGEQQPFKVYTTPLPAYADADAGSSRRVTPTTKRVTPTTRLLTPSVP